ncbi:MAG: alpha/beta hydrolase [Chloroflexi bacterium]|nr:alpha/beta hydrolase [Chloroflexota bacterium]
MTQTRRFILGSLGVAGLVLLGWICLNGQREIRAARERVQTGGRIVETAAGPIEYAASGDGLPVLVVHGAGGGYDQGLLLGEMIVGDTFRQIAPSRFGYLSTPIPADASPAAQADAHAALLDELGISQVAIVGVSAGGPSALQFALRHPDRCAALVMVSAISDAPELQSSPSPAPDGVYKMLFQWDPVYWLMTKAASSAFYSLFGLSFEVQAQLASEEERWLADFLQATLPVSMRADGMFNDMIPRAPQDRRSLERIVAPTLVVHTIDDTLVPFQQGQFTAQSIPGAQLVALQDGGHLLMGRHAEIKAAVETFLNQYSW